MATTPALPKLFVSHASEDKDALVRPLVTSLKRRKVPVWYDEYSLNAGDSLRASIDKGLDTCDYGLVILSDAFFSKKWTADELEGLFARETVAKENLIIPVWHNVDHRDVTKFSPILANRVAIVSNNVRDIAAKVKSSLLQRDAAANRFEQVFRSPYGGSLQFAYKPNVSAPWPGRTDGLTKERIEQFYYDFVRQIEDDKE